MTWKILGLLRDEKKTTVVPQEEKMKKVSFKITDGKRPIRSLRDSSPAYDLRCPFDFTLDPDQSRDVRMGIIVGSPSVICPSSTTNEMGIQISGGTPFFHQSGKEIVLTLKNLKKKAVSTILEGEILAQLIVLIPAELDLDPAKK
jgi:hypothetical protein